MLYIIYLVGGIIIGVMVTTFFWLTYFRRITYGTLKKAVDDGETYLFLDLDEPPEKILQREQVMFRVDHKDYTPHE